MGKTLFVIPECFVDTNLTKTLLNSNVNHQRGCNQVCKIMQDKFGDSFAVGIIVSERRIGQTKRKF